MAEKEPKTIKKRVRLGRKEAVDKYLKKGPGPKPKKEDK